MPVVINDFEVLTDEPNRPPSPSTSTAPSPPAPTAPSTSRLEQALKQLWQRAERVHAD